MIMRGSAAILLASFFAAVPSAAQNAPLAEEATPSVQELPDHYPASYVFVHDLNFQSLVDGRIAVVDVAAPDRGYKGQFTAAQLGVMIASARKSELYVAETYYSRLNRGERTDVITIWDKKSLSPTGEIILPGGKRGQFVTLPNSFQFTNGEKWGLVFNFTPASSVTVVDLEKRMVLVDIDLPGCSLIYPTGERGFMSLCADGTMTSIALDTDGTLAGTTTSEVFNDIDGDPMFMTPAMIGRTAWFVTFKGAFRGVDLSQASARDLGGFSLAGEKSDAGEWRPGGWQVISASADGQLFVLMSPAGKEGSHKDGGSEIWVVDPAKKSRTARWPLRNPAVSIEVTAEPKPSLVAARHDGSLDIYDAASGTFQRTIQKVGNSPMAMAASR